MRSLARWSIVLAFCAAVVGAAAQLAWDHGTRPAASAAASADAVGTLSGFKSPPAPERPAYIGPGVGISSTVINAVVASQCLVAWRLPSRATAASSPALHASRVSPHLRSIPLLI